MPKFYATRLIELNGRTYNRGDIVEQNEIQDGLVLCDAVVELPSPRKRIEKNILVGSDDPEISVIITFHDQKEFVDDCLEGFYRQSIDVPYEIVVVDDDSKDGTEQYIKEKYPEVRYFKVNFHKSGASRNFGFKQTKGDFICYFDGDDFPYPDYLKKMHDALVRNSKYNLAYSRFDYPFTGPDKFLLSSCNSFEWNSSWINYAPIVNTPSMIRREIAKKARWDEKLYTYEDYDFNLSLLKAGANGVCVRERLWNYRYHPKSKWGSNVAFENRERDDAYLVNKWKLDRTPAEVTMVSLVARKNVINEYFDGIEKLKMPREKMHYLVFCDTNDEELVDIVKERTKGYKFLSTRIYVSGEQSLGMSDVSPAREERITRNLRTILNDVNRWNNKSEFIFMVEDDTIAPPNAFQKLYKRIKENKNLAYITGVETSRGYDMHAGVATMTEENGEIKNRINPPYKKSGIGKINAGGWYCWMGRPRMAIEMPFRHLIGNGRYIGPDYMMVYDLAKKGYDTEVDWSVGCLHYDPHGKRWIRPDEARGWEYEYVKVGQNYKVEQRPI